MLSFGRGPEWKDRAGSGVQQAVQEALDTELDAYLDRELFVQPDPEVKPAPGAEKPAECLQSVLALAVEEEHWLRTLPAPELAAENSRDLEGETCPIPEHLRPVSEAAPGPEVAPVPVEFPWTPPSAPLPGLASAPHLAQPGWNLPVAPVAAPPATARTSWIAIGALGVSAASLLVAGALWMQRGSLPDRAQVLAAYVPAGTVTAVPLPPATPAREPVLSVKDSPLARQPEQIVAGWKAETEESTGALPGPVVPGRVSASNDPPAPTPVTNPELRPEPTPGAIAQAAVSPEPLATTTPGAISHAAQEAVRPIEATGSREPVIASTKAETPKARETAQARRTPAVQERQDIEDPTLEDTEEETPFQQPAVAHAATPVDKAATPPATHEPSEYDEFDREFARELGFTNDAVRKEPEKKGVKTVWIPPNPAEDIPQTLSPEDIQRVVVANQPAITSCIQKNKEAIPGLNGGKFVMRWFMYPSGSTYGVAMETQALRGTALATCVEDLVKDWKFPKHQTQMGPIRFPFIF